MFCDFRVTITGQADSLFLESMIRDIRNLTPENGGFTLEFGPHAKGDDG